ncbi:MAG: A24 family peptidase [Candidatus Omnitrophota bacterium]
MIDYIHACAYVGVISILILLAPLVYYDIKYRRVPTWTLWLLIGLNVPAIYVLYSEGLPLFYIMLSIIMTVLFGVLYKVGALKGGDIKLLTVIAWACPLNPWNPNDTFFQIQFTIFLAAAAVMWAIYVYFKNRRTDLFNGMSLWQKFNNYPNGSPWMVPIAIAFVITAAFG